jgi:hypothetical protein
MSERIVTELPRGFAPCHMEVHYGCIAPLNHHRPELGTGWRGICGTPTNHRLGLCADCREAWKVNFPGYAFPRGDAA